MLQIIFTIGLSIIGTNSVDLTLNDFKLAIEDGNVDTVRTYINCCYSQTDYIDGQQVGLYVTKQSSFDLFKVFIDELAYEGSVGDEIQIFHSIVHLYSLDLQDKGKYMLDNHIKNYNGSSSENFLITAIQFEQDELAGDLLSAGADPNIKGKDGFLPIEIAIRHGFIELAKKLKGKSNLTEEQLEYYNCILNTEL